VVLRDEGLGRHDGQAVSPIGPATEPHQRQERWIAGPGIFNVYDASAKPPYQIVRIVLACFDGTLVEMTRRAKRRQGRRRWGLAVRIRSHDPCG
jgi:hypothetical protein